MRRLTIIILAMVLTLGLAAAASADTISWNGWQQTGLDIKGKVGNRNMDINQVGAFDVSWDEGESLTAYCVDLLTSGVGGTYDVTSLDLLDSEEYSYLYQAAWIMDNYSPALDNDVAHMNDSQVVTAIQAALWNLTTDPDNSYWTFNLTKVDGESSKWWKSETMKLYYEMLDAAGDVDFSSYTFKNDYYFAQSDRKQDLLIAGNSSGPGGETPEPGTMLLLGSALGVFAWRRRRKSA